MADLERDFPGYRGPYRDGKLHVLATKCSTCIFRPGDLMRITEQRRDEIERENLAANAALTCHQTLPYGKDPQSEGAVCRGYWDRNRRESMVLRLAQSYGIVQEVPCPTPSASCPSTPADPAAGRSTATSTTSTGKPAGTPGTG